LNGVVGSLGAGFRLDCSNRAEVSLGTQLSVMLVRSNRGVGVGLSKAKMALGARLTCIRDDSRVETYRAF